MLCYALICAVAFMLICGRCHLYTISIRPTSSFSDNSLTKDADLDGAIEPEINQENEGNLVERREDTNDEENPTNEEAKVKCPPNERCSRCPEHHHINCTNQTEDKSANLNNIKRELCHLGTLFVNKFLGTEEQGEVRPQRAFDGFQEKLLSDNDSLDDDDEDENNDDMSKVKDKDFMEKQAKVENATKDTKELFNLIENPPPAEESEECCEEAQKESGSQKAQSLVGDNSQKAQSLVGDNLRKTQLGPTSDLLEMHFFKYLPDVDGLKITPKDEKPVLINLYPEQHKSRSFETPKNYDYVALLSKDNKLVKVPAVKFTVVPENQKKRRRRSENYEHFFTSRYKRQPGFRFEPTNVFRVIDNGILGCGHMTHVPILFVNTISEMQGTSNYGNKRSPNFDTSDNKYLRAANLLIQNLNTSLRMGLDEFKKPTPVNSGILINSKYDSSLVNQNKEVFKKEIQQGLAAAPLQNKVLSLGSDSPPGLVNNEFSALLKKEYDTRNQINLMDLAADREDS